MSCDQIQVVFFQKNFSTCSDYIQLFKNSLISQKQYLKYLTSHRQQINIIQLLISQKGYQNYSTLFLFKKLQTLYLEQLIYSQIQHGIYFRFWMQFYTKIISRRRQVILNMQLCDVSIINQMEYFWRQEADSGILKSKGFIFYWYVLFFNFIGKKIVIQNVFYALFVLKVQQIQFKIVRFKNFYFEYFIKLYTFIIQVKWLIIFISQLLE
ncbi:transmembrane protein, putative (macronuclear) [Tetrahymena thermophila SB210]|uniref:Transmembrane protein, putative n=1 Tax=Tetrahymena thermophila (strain SB210) TaxID=312017 RepID=W7XGH9_TETTS|nr:transmembrane protein, putative [Tetrahymena thermophila SB210]EWS76103.1 transmembrane protein, putative [Tetrahymena thermophila SB210]|eukprot:XP_012651343.1 transmembrane protein, putative [Tetrahymena thermophila SB210]